MSTIKTVLFSLMHLVVDGICGFVIFASLYPFLNTNDAFIIFILYNSCAFVLQPLTGFLVDKFNYDKLILIALTFVLTLCLCVNINPYLSCILIGISNAFFHTIGGKYVLKNKQNSMSLQGIFVSLGAIGLVLGSYFYGNILKIIFLFLVFILLTLLVFLKDDSDKEQTIKTENTEAKTKKLLPKETIIIIILLLIVTFVRAFWNKGTTYVWNTSKNTILLVSVITALGKILGGILGDKFGIRNTIIISFAISFVSIFLTGQNMFLDLVSILAINFSMPITLYLLNKSFPNHEGFNFGLLAAVLFPGYLLGMNEFVSKNIIIFAPIAIIISTAAIIYVNYKEKKNGII
jgi:MFS transporter, FSR family, fosmidomycin resistance protein